MCRVYAKFIFVGFFMDIDPTLAYDSLGDHVGMLLLKAVVLTAGGALESWDSLCSSKKCYLCHLCIFLLFSVLIFILKWDSHLSFSEYVPTSYLCLLLFCNLYKFVICTLANSVWNALYEWSIHSVTTVIKTLLLLRSLYQLSLLDPMQSKANVMWGTRSSSRTWGSRHRKIMYTKSIRSSL